MYTPDSLLDVHARCHQSLRMFLGHCRELAPEELDRALDGFGYATVRMQLHHVLSAQRYWLTVVLGSMDAGENDADYPTVESLEAFRAEVFAATEDYLRTTSTEDLNTPREMVVWRGTRTTTPARVLLRTQTHVFQHLGQVAAMCRLLDRPVPQGMDFPLE